MALLQQQQRSKQEGGAVRNAENVSARQRDMIKQIALNDLGSGWRHSTRGTLWQLAAEGIIDE